MAESNITLYYKNVMADVIGEEHGITQEQLDGLEKQIRPLISGLKREITGEKTRYGELPFNSGITEDVKRVADELKKRCEILVVLGIGGSALGNIALQTALNPYMFNLDEKQRRGPQLFVFDNVDPEQFGSFLDWVGDRLDETVFNVISKSGRTVETASQFLIVRDMLLEKLGTDDLKEQVVATTDPKWGTLRKIAAEDGIRCLEVHEGVGGRFSVLSAVGLFSAYMCGIDIDALLAGARDMETRVNCEEFRKNPAALNAAIHYHYYQHGKKISVMMPYSYALRDFAGWYRQLWAESLGKAVDLKGNKVYIGPIPVKALGATDQHSQVQLYREGPNDKVFTFLEVENFRRQVKIKPAPDCAPELKFLEDKDLGVLLNKEKQATEYALVQAGRPCLTVRFPEISPYTIGQFIYLFEATTSFTGGLFNIDTYDQPGVELGKDATLALMGKRGEYKEGLTYEKFAEIIKTETKINENYLV